MIRAILTIHFLLIIGTANADIIMPKPLTGLEAEAKNTILCIRLFDHEFEVHKFSPALQARISAEEYLSDVLRKAQPVHLDKLDRQVTSDDIERSINPVDIKKLAGAISSGVTWRQPKGYSKENRFYLLTYTCNRHLADKKKEWSLYLSKVLK